MDSPRSSTALPQETLETLHKRLNKSLTALREGQFDHKRGFEAVQALQSKLVRLQNSGFELGERQSLADVQNSLLEHAALYAQSPAVVGGMVRLTEVLGLAAVALAAKGDEVRGLLDTYLDPLEQRYSGLQDKLRTTETELTAYRGQISEALDRTAAYQRELNAKSALAQQAAASSSGKSAEETSKKTIITQERRVRELEAQVLRLKAENASLNAGNSGKGSVTQNATLNAASQLALAAPKQQQNGNQNQNQQATNQQATPLERVGELEKVLDLDKSTLDPNESLLAPMIKDGLNYLRTLLLMQQGPPGPPGGGGNSNTSRQDNGANATNNTNNNMLFFTEGNSIGSRSGGGPGGGGADDSSVIFPAPRLG